MKTQKFKLNQEVYDTTYGWGKVVERKEDCYQYPIKVKFHHRQKSLPLLEYSIDGDNWEEVDDNYTVCVVKFELNEKLEHFTKHLATKTLSFAEYTLQGFSQEKPLT